MNEQELQNTARELVREGKGILAADESFGTIGKRFSSIGIESTPETRRAYRQMLFSTEGIEQYISGVILFDETIRQVTIDGVPMRELLSERGILVGIKVDEGAKDLAFYPGGKITEGLDGLRERFKEYRELGARFSKWRAVIAIGEGISTRFCIESNAQAIARYAALSQEADLVPIVEPEVLMDGDHSIERCEEVTETTLRSVFSHLSEHRVMLEGMLLKTNMVLSGKESSEQAGIEQVAEYTIRCLRRTVPAAVPGVVFLSGGQSSELATEHLNAMNAMGPQPWQLGFSYARALQDPAMKIWKGDESNVLAAQKAFYLRAQCNSAARYGNYKHEMEKAA